MKECNFDGLIGPTHNYSGLSLGNLASQLNQNKVSNPKKAALQGLAKMHQLHQLGLKQGIIPPQERPLLPFLFSIGYIGPDQDILQKVWKDSPSLFQACYSSSSMWTANAATVAPSVDTEDGLVHFIPANLATLLHRFIESPETSRFLKVIFNHPSYFKHHPPLPPHLAFADEGAANHIRFCNRHADQGVHLFVYGKNEQSHPGRFPARQTQLASEAVARINKLSPEQVIFAKQNTEAIDAGVFHNDVISTGNEYVFLLHEKAFTDNQAVIDALKTKINNLKILLITEEELPLAEAVSSYLFNSQILTLPNQEMLFLAPQECLENPKTAAYLNQLIKNKSQPIRHLQYQDLRESMQNGGGPACLRLRVLLKPEEEAAVLPSIWMTDSLYPQLVQWVESNFRDRLTIKDLLDPLLLEESRSALDQLTKILGLGPIYSFQNAK